MGYLYSRMLASANSPAPAKPKKKTAKPKAPKPSVPKPAVPKPTVSKPTVPKPAAPNTTTHITTAATKPKQTIKDIVPIRSEPTGSNKPIVIPPPVNFRISPSTTPTSTHIPERKLSTPTNHVEHNIMAYEPNKNIAREATPKSIRASELANTTKTSIVSTQKTTVDLESKGKPAKKAKLSLDDEMENKMPKEPKTQAASKVTNTTRAKTTSTRGRGRGKTVTKSTRPAASTTEPKRGKKRTIETDDEEESSQRKEPKSRHHQQPLPILNGTYKLSLVFKGHTDINIPAKDANDDDFEDAKDIWCCEFEPTQPNQIEKTNVVAICGSYTVLLLDTHQARYTKKYTHTEIQEIFYCMAWTTLSGAQLLNSNMVEDQGCNILAIAGRLGSIKLLNPLQNECYRYLFGHEKAVLKMVFAKSDPRWLFTASADKTVRLWDIGSPTSKHDDSVCLAKFTLPPKTGAPSSLGISYDLSTLMVGFDNGDMVYFHISPETLNNFRLNLDEYRSKEAAAGDKWAAFGPLVTIAPKMIYPKGGEWHEGYIDDIYVFGQDGDTSSKLYNKIISRGADDMEFIIWDREKSTKSDADILLSLEWPDSAGCTGLRYKVIEAEGQKVLIAGEYDGQICIYNVGQMKNSKTLADNSVEQFKPTKMLSHSMSSELIRDVCCSNDTRTIVAVDNNNTVFVWNCID